MSTNALVAKDKMKKIGEFPVLQSNSSLKKALDEMTDKRLGVACFIDSNGSLAGLLTDGDLRRLLLGNQSPLPALLISDAINFGTKKPTVAQAESTLGEIAKVMIEKQLWDIPVVDSNNKLLGLLHRHDVS
ncbi:MAG: CBS domain-containing protein [Actinomycetes bacterium]